MGTQLPAAPEESGLTISVCIKKHVYSQFLPVGDLSGDCKVDYTDLDTMANAWLAKQVIIPPVTNPGTTGLRLWYKFEETTGTTIADSSGNGFDGEVNSTPLFADVDASTDHYFVGSHRRFRRQRLFRQLSIRRLATLT